MALNKQERAQKEATQAELYRLREELEAALVSPALEELRQEELRQRYEAELAGLRHECDRLRLFIDAAEKYKISNPPLQHGHTTRTA